MWIVRHAREVVVAQRHLAEIRQHQRVALEARQQREAEAGHLVDSKCVVMLQWC